MNRRSAVIVFSKAPHVARGNADEPFAALPWDDLDALFTAFLGDIIQNACQIAEVDVLLYRNPSELSDDFLAPFRERVILYDVVDGSFTRQVQHAVDESFLNHYDRIVVLLENHPIVNPYLIRRMLGMLTHDDDCVVITPTIEGRCLMLGMKTNHSWVFEDSEGDPLVKPFVLLQRLCSIETQILTLPPGYLLDSGLNLARLKGELDGREGRDIDFPRRSYEMFRMLEKKYKMSKPAR